MEEIKLDRNNLEMKVAAPLKNLIVFDSFKAHLIGQVKGKLKKNSFDSGDYSMKYPVNDMK